MSKQKQALTDMLYDEVKELSEYITKNIEGELLTLIDASISDPEQRKALKNVIQNKIIYGRDGLRNKILERQNGIVVGLYHALEMKRDYTDSDTMKKDRPRWVNSSIYPMQEGLFDDIDFTR